MLLIRHPSPLKISPAPAGVILRQPTVADTVVVDRAPWPNTPDCPFIIELFTAPAVRRQGLAKTLLTTCLQHPTAFALQVATDNTPAVDFYESLSFQPG
jgi:ribosomal protein S18 acetylase RimI-like enzyme